MARARLRIVTVRDEDILNSEAPDSKSVPVAKTGSDSAKKTTAKATKARQSKSGPSGAQQVKVEKPQAQQLEAQRPKAEPLKAEPLKAQQPKTEPRRSPAAKAANTSASADGSVRARVQSGTKATSASKAAVATPVVVASVMQTNVVTCSPGEALSSVGQAMWDNDVGAVVVVDEQRRPQAVVTDRDLAMAAYTQGIALGHIGVGICMSKRLVTCGVEADTTQVAALMREHRVRRIPVVDANGQLAGIVGLRDLLKGDLLKGDLLNAANGAKTSAKPTDVLMALSGVLG